MSKIKFWQLLPNVFFYYYYLFVMMDKIQQVHVLFSV